MDFATVLFMIVSPTGAVLIVILNSVQIFYIIHRNMIKKMKSIVYILNLAISDLFLGLVILTVKVLKTIEEKTGLDDKYRMVLQLHVLYVSLYVSVLSLAALNLERLLLVLKPIFYSRMKYGTKIKLCVLMWIITVAAIFAHREWINDHNKEMIKTAIIIFATAVLNIVSYAFILRSVRQHREMTMRLRQSISNLSEVRQTKSEQRFLSYCIKSFVAFLIFWIPIAIYGLLLATGVITEWKKNIVNYITHILAFWNSLASPIIFLHHNRKVVFPKKERNCKQKKNSSSSTSTTKELTLATRQSISSVDENVFIGSQLH